MGKKYIFLDIDGVLNNNYNSNNRFTGLDIDPYNI
jgi:histidinol phosphatase-like enzyme